MTSLYLNGVNAPDEIKASLQDLSKSINFEKEDIKAANGHVFFGRNRVTSKEVAVKFYYWGGKTAFHAEPKQLAEVNSPNVLPIHDAGLIDSTWAYFLTPRCVNGDLDDLLERTSIGNHAAIDYTYQVLSGLSHLHGKRFLHRDLKPANIYVDQAYNAVIGDFGSVKRLPEGHSSIPASSHSILYRPPETITTNSYGITGDIYQCGIVLYQLLGGYLPYDGIAYLSRQQKQQMKSMPSSVDENIFVDQCIKTRICSGKLLDYDSMPVWVPGDVKKIIKKATHINPTRRFQTASAFMAKLHGVRPTVLDWKVVDGNPQLSAQVSYRIVGTPENSRVQKARAGAWRNDNSFGVGSVNELILAVSGAAT
jgi:serine/threonine protein kinase